MTKKNEDGLAQSLNKLLETVGAIMTIMIIGWLIKEIWNYLLG